MAVFHDCFSVFLKEESESSVDDDFMGVGCFDVGGVMNAWCNFSVIRKVTIEVLNLMIFCIGCCIAIASEVVLAN